MTGVLAGQIIYLLWQYEDAASRKLRTELNVGACARRSRLQPCVCVLVVRCVKCFKYYRPKKDVFSCVVERCRDDFAVETLCILLRILLP